MTNINYNLHIGKIEIEEYIKDAKNRINLNQDKQIDPYYVKLFSDLSKCFLDNPYTIKSETIISINAEKNNKKEKFAIKMRLISLCSEPKIKSIIGNNNFDTQCELDLFLRNAFNIKKNYSSNELDEYIKNKIFAIKILETHKFSNYLSEQEKIDIIIKYKKDWYKIKFGCFPHSLDTEEDYKISNFLKKYQFDSETDIVNFNKFVDLIKKFIIISYEDGYKQFSSDSELIELLFRIINGYNIFISDLPEPIHPYQYYKEDKKNFIKKIVAKYFENYPIFFPYRSYDFSFLNHFNDNVKNTLINRINEDSSNHEHNVDNYLNMHNLIDNIEDLITIQTFYLNPDPCLKLLEC